MSYFKEKGWIPHQIGTVSELYNREINECFRIHIRWVAIIKREKFRFNYL